MTFCATLSIENGISGIRIASALITTRASSCPCRPPGVSSRSTNSPARSLRARVVAVALELQRAAVDAQDRIHRAEGDGHHGVDGHHDQIDV